MIKSGTTIENRYEVGSKIGSGRIADVFKAADLESGKDVAVKVIKAELCGDQFSNAKFYEEILAVAGLKHTNIAGVYDAGIQGNSHYIIMEYVPGITLKDYLAKKGRRNYQETLSIAIWIARAIQSAHAKEIIHGDISTRNIMVSTRGEIKVTDFGIADAMKFQKSPKYRGSSIADDVYAIGTVMYEMMAGQPPFRTSADGETTQGNPPDISRYAPDIPISLKKVIQKCMQEDPYRRYGSMGELLADLRQSLLTPDKDFVVMMPMLASTAASAEPEMPPEITPETRKEKPVEDKTPEEPAKIPAEENITEEPAGNGLESLPEEEDKKSRKGKKSRKEKKMENIQEEEAVTDEPEEDEMDDSMEEEADYITTTAIKVVKVFLIIALIIFAAMLVYFLIVYYDLVDVTGITSAIQDFFGNIGENIRTLIGNIGAGRN